jgi:hypothetical protein
VTKAEPTSCTAFAGTRRIAFGDLAKVALKAKVVWDRDKWAQVLIFDDATSALIEVDFRGTAREVLRRITKTVNAAAPAVAEQPVTASRGPGRPRLGVVAREVTLLPRHWDWLASQPGGASVALRKLVEQARQSHRGQDAWRKAQESAYRFLSAMAGNEPGFEEAIRALFANQPRRFQEIVQTWPRDIRDHSKKLAAAVFQEEKYGIESSKKRSDPPV